MREVTRVILDLETTGLSPQRHKITEIAAIKVVNEKVVDKFQTLVNPKVPIPRFITKLTGITNEMVENEPEITQVLPSLKKFIGDSVIVGHNVSFDYRFLQENFWRHENIMLTNDTICTMKLARRLNSELPSKRLGALCEHYNVVNEQAHRAMADVKATHEILNNMLDTLNNCGVCNYEETKNFECGSIAKAMKILHEK